MKKDIDKGKHHKRERERMWGNEKERKIMMSKMNIMTCGTFVAICGFAR